MELIKHLIKNAKKYNLDVIDETDLHCRIEIIFNNDIVIRTKGVEFYNVKSLIYNTEIYDFVVCIEDGYEIGYIDNEDYIIKIYNRYGSDGLIYSSQ